MVLCPWKLSAECPQNETSTMYYSYHRKGELQVSPMFAINRFTEVSLCVFYNMVWD